MAKTQNEHEAINSDSFVDIIASVVSVMLIMVMLIGMRIRSVSIEELADAGAEEAQQELQRAVSVEESTRNETLEAARRIGEIEQWARARAAHRDTLALTAAAIRRQMEEDRGRLAGDEREQFELVRRLEEGRIRLTRLRQQIDQSQHSPQPEIESLAIFPTPISRRVEGPEKHFQLRWARIAPVPLQQLTRAAEEAARRKGLDRDGRLSDAVGPIGGFTMKYSVQLRRRDADGLPSGGPGWTESRCEIYPTSETLGETVDEALAPVSAFRDELAACKPGRHTITLWVYPDSFDGFRKVRDELYRLRFAVAVWPLPENAPIAGSSDGDRSAAQ